MSNPIHAERRAAGICINNEKHGAAVKGGRCARCWEAKVDGQRKRPLSFRIDYYLPERRAILALLNRAPAR